MTTRLLKLLIAIRWCLLEYVKNNAMRQIYVGYHTFQLKCKAFWNIFWVFEGVSEMSDLEQKSFLVDWSKDNLGLWTCFMFHVHQPSSLVDTFRVHQWKLLFKGNNFGNPLKYKSTLTTLDLYSSSWIVRFLDIIL